MEQKTKRIIAREGLIILSVFFFGFITSILFFEITDHHEPVTTFFNVYAIGFPILIYSFYLLIRFVLWSIKTIKNRTGENE